MIFKCIKVSYVLTFFYGEINFHENFISTVMLNKIKGNFLVRVFITNISSLSDTKIWISLLKSSIEPRNKEKYQKNYVLI